MSTVIKATNLDISKLTFSALKTDNNQRKMVFVNLDGKKVIIQTPLMNVPNGIKKWHKDGSDGKDDAYEMELSFGGENPDVKVFHEKMQQFDEAVKSQIMLNCKEWLGKPKVSMELIENAFFASSVRIATDKEGNVLDYPSKIRAKLDRGRTGDDFTGKFVSYKKTGTPILMFDENKQEIMMDESNFDTVVPKSSSVVAVLELVYLTITTKVSAKWKLVQAKVTKGQTNITGYAMLDDDVPSNGQEDLDSETSPVTQVTRAVETVKLDSDSEDSEDSEDSGVVQDNLDSEVEQEVVEPVSTKPKPRGKKATL